jgi:hypothetical protein
VTTTAPPADTDQRAADALARAVDLIAASDLRLARNVTPDQAARVLATALTGASPEHAGMLAAALSRRTKSQRKAGKRPDAWRVARRLVERGVAPTAAAVAGRLRDQAIKQAAQRARIARLAHVADRDGGDVARFVAAYRRHHGAGPGWGMVSRHMRRQWRRDDSNDAIHALLAAGWLIGGKQPGDLAPGPRAKGLVW